MELVKKNLIHTIRPALLLSIHVHLGRQSGLFLSGFRQNFVCILNLSHACSMLSAPYPRFVQSTNPCQCICPTPCIFKICINVILPPMPSEPYFPSFLLKQYILHSSVPAIYPAHFINIDLISQKNIWWKVQLMCISWLRSSLQTPYRPASSPYVKLFCHALYSQAP